MIFTKEIKNNNKYLINITPCNQNSIYRIQKKKKYKNILEI